MRFREPAIEALDLRDAECIRKLIVEYLCARHSPSILDSRTHPLLGKLLKSAADSGFSFEQFNELLLLLNQDRLSRAFFEFFFGREPTGLDGLKAGVVKFRGFAMLRFGNFRYAYRRLSTARAVAVVESLAPYSREPAEVRAGFEGRSGPSLDIEEIQRDETWYVGELTGAVIDKHLEGIALLLRQEADSDRQTELRGFWKQLQEKAEKYEHVQRRALQNTDVYLTWDFLDVYIATSMRCDWEFQQTFDFVREVFSESELCDLQLRHFDPTQCKCSNPRDKGLVEGLMLKRARCTIYMAQEADTMGKDSELAATLAQGRPVIVYVPQVEVESYAQKIRDYPLEYFYRRLLFLKAEQVLADATCADELMARTPDYEKLVNQFILDYEEYRANQPLALWHEKDKTDFKAAKPRFGDLCQVLAVGEKRAYERRAAVLKGLHPLAMQVDMQTGVAVGVLVVRSARECAQVLKRLLLNELDFQLDEVGGRDEVDRGFTILKEGATDSQFRVVTHDEKVTNSFWNLFDGPGPIVEEWLP